MRVRIVLRNSDYTVVDAETGRQRYFGFGRLESTLAFCEEFGLVVVSVHGTSPFIPH